MRRVVAARKEHALAASMPPDKRFVNPFKQHAPLSQQLSSNPVDEKVEGDGGYPPTLARKPKKQGFWAKFKCW